MIPFGFSAGDFAAGLVLLHKVIAALREIDGASSQFSFTIMELEVLQTILRKIQCLQRSEIATEHLDTLCFLGHQCHLPLAAFLERMKDMKPELDVYTDGKGAVHMRMKRSFRKAQWGIQLKNHVVELKAAIAPQLTTIGILLQLIDLEQQAKIAQSQSRSMQTVEDLLSKIKELESHLDARTDALSFVMSPNPLPSLFQSLHTKLDISKISPACQLGSQQKIASSQSEVLQSSPQAVTDTVHTAFSMRVDNTSSEISDIKKMLMGQNTLIQQLVVRGEQAGASSLSGTNKSSSAFSTTYKTLRVDHDFDCVPFLTPDATILTLLERVKLGVKALVVKLLLLLYLVRRAFQMLSATPAAPTMLLDDNILFEDALGRTISLPYAHFRHYPVFIARLQCEFRDLPGERKILRNCYLLFNRRNRCEFVTQDTWDSRVQPGAVLGMSIEVDRVHYVGRSCPRCNILTATKRPKRLQSCASCGLNYVLKEEFLVNETLQNGEPDRAQKCEIQNFGPISEASAQQPFTTNKTGRRYSVLKSLKEDENDLLVFKTVHLSRIRDPQAIAAVHFGLRNILLSLRLCYKLDRSDHYSSLDEFISSLRSKHESYERLLNLILPPIVGKRKRHSMIKNPQHKLWSHPDLAEAFRKFLGEYNYSICMRVTSGFERAMLPFVMEDLQLNNVQIVRKYCLMAVVVASPRFTSQLNEHGYKDTEEVLFGERIRESIEENRVRLFIDELDRWHIVLEELCDAILAKSPKM